jgi:hypothetical protein
MEKKIKRLSLAYLVVGIFVLLVALMAIWISTNPFKIGPWDEEDSTVYLIVGSLTLVSGILLIYAFYGFYFQKKYSKYIGLSGNTLVFSFWIIAYASTCASAPAPFEVTLIIITPLLFPLMLAIFTLIYWKNLP